LVLKIKGKNLYSSEGERLKEISCPKNVKRSDLSRKEGSKLYCDNCERDIINTDFLDEEGLLVALRKQPEACVSINLMNPLFKLEN